MPKKRSNNAPKTVLITGAARRVGRAIAEELHRVGFNTLIHYRSSATEAEALVGELNEKRAHSAFAFGADLVDAHALPRLIDETLAHFGRLDGLINSASSFYPQSLADTTQADWDALIGSNLRAPLFLSQAAAPYLRQTAGSIINITDIHAERPLAGYLVYCTAKAGLLGLTRALALELAPEIRVNAVAPGPILWPEGSDFDTASRQAAIDHTLLKRCGEPADIARTVRFLLIDAPYISGQVINVDGGRSAHL